MKKYIIFGLILVSLLILAVTALFASPYYFYNKTINFHYKSSWFFTSRYSKDFIRGQKQKSYDLKQVNNPELWRKFHFGDLLIPLPYPTGNPYFTVIPNLQHKKKTTFSLSIASIRGRVYNKIFALPIGPFPDYLTEQKIFDLPVVRAAITKNDSDKIWEDVFSKDIRKWDITLEEMAYNLYLLHFRSKFFNPKMRNHYIYKENKKAVQEIESEDKDFITEIIFEKRGQSLFSYLLLTRKGSEQASQVRDYLVKNMEFLESTPSLTDIIFREFKALNYQDQVSPTGMLYLISAWSHNTSRVEVLERAIYHLERGAKGQVALNQASNNPKMDYKAPNLIQLKPLYMFYYNRYQRFYSNFTIPGLDLPENLLLKKNVELEKRKSIQDEIKELEVIPEIKKQPTIDEDYERLIQKTKRPREKKKNKILID